MEGIDGGLHPAVDGQSLGQSSKSKEKMLGLGTDEVHPFPCRRACKFREATLAEGLPVSSTWTEQTKPSWGRYYGGRRPSSVDSLHSPTVIPPSALDRPSIMKRYHRRRTCSHISPRRPPTMVTLHDTRFVECRWGKDGWTVKTVVN